MAHRPSLQGLHRRRDRAAPGVAVAADHGRELARDALPAALPDGNEQTGIWGVGGPSMREPGSTGVFLSRRSTDRH
jgi:hypothetical protein